MSATRGDRRQEEIGGIDFSLIFVDFGRSLLIFSQILDPAGHPPICMLSVRFGFVAPLSFHNFSRSALAVIELPTNVINIHAFFIDLHRFS